MLQVCGVTVSSYTKGTQSGQFRMTLKTEGEDAVRATENYSIAKMTLKRYFQRKGVEVTYVPCEPDIVGSNLVPITLSLWKDGKNVSGDEFSLY